MNDYELWRQKYPHAAAELEHLLQPPASEDVPDTGSESAAQKQVRLSIARQGALSWRNNVGATQTRCHHRDCGGKLVCAVCHTAPQQVRYGLANDSPRLNAQIKSHDLILGIPRHITPAMVGTTLLQFGSVEAKRPGWVFSGKGREAGQAAWGALIQSKGGFAAFSTGEVLL